LRQTAIVTGGAGFVGSHLCERLLADGFEVVCLDNLSTGTPENAERLGDIGPFRMVPCDITTPVDLPGRAEFVFHLASPASPIDYLRLPVETLMVGSLGTRNALDLAAEKHARFLFTSTSEIYGDPQVHPQPETYWGHVNSIGPRSVYDEAKRFAEALVTAYRHNRGVSTAIARLFNTYGPRMRHSDGRAVPTFIDQALKGAPLTVAGDGRQTRSICYVSDVVEGLIRLAHSEWAGPVNIGNPAEMTVLDLALLVRRICGSASEISYITRPTDDPQQRRPDIALARRLLDWKPAVPPEEGLKLTVDWCLEQQSSPASVRRAGGDPYVKQVGN
jgi:dTDP-glucose 4,6-dehydratase